MSDARKAVFLSYASQDAEAARKICEALRSSGVEVWFDVEGGLEHGDEWDAKIRRQIKECVLFIAVISANTQARHEGYFRIEWDLAAERARGIASGVAFLLPVVIDDTREPEALVPDRFRSVQWTRLPGGIVPPEVQARFLKLWSHRTGVLKHEAVSRGLTTEDSGRRTGDGADQSHSRKRSPAAMAFAILALVAVAAFLVWRPWQSSDPDLLARSSPALSSSNGLPATPPISEARQLVAKAWEQLNKTGLARAELEMAERLCKQAAELDPNDPEVWAAWSQVDTWYLYTNLERTPERREGASSKAARALRIAPDSYEARLAQACFFVREESHEKSIFADEAERHLRRLLEERAEEPRALFALGILLRNGLRHDEGARVLDRLARQPAFAATALSEKGFLRLFEGRFQEAGECADQSIAVEPFYGNLALKTFVAMDWYGDLDQARDAVEMMPAAALMEDYGAGAAYDVYWRRREPDKMLRMLRAHPREWLSSNILSGPKQFYVGVAYQMAGRLDAARTEWRTALEMLNLRLQNDPNSSEWHLMKAKLLVWLGVIKTDVEEQFRLARDFAPDDWQRYSVDVERTILSGDVDGFIRVIEQSAKNGLRWALPAALRTSPMYDPIRADPRFQTLLARMEADPQLSPNARPSAPANRKHVDDKSVAVLAFANLSDDRANEYFSDGISEELLNVLAKIPGLKVTARTSAFFFKGKQVPIADIAQQLGVAYVIEGSVRKQGDRVRITAQLIKAADGFPVWSDTFTRDLKDIFAVQDEISSHIAQQLQLKLGATKVARVVNPEAYRLVLEGRYFWLQRTEEALNRAEASYAKALEHDPQFAQAHAGLADVWSIRAWYKLIGGNRQAEDDLSRAHTEVRLAIEIDPSLPETYATLGAVLFNQRKFSEANQAFQNSQRLNPNYGFAHFWHAQLLFAEGRAQEGLLALDRAIRADPLAFITLASYAIFLSQLGFNEEALVMNDRAIALHPDMFVPIIGQRANILLRLGRKEEALELARSVVQHASVQPRWWLDGTVIHVLRATGQQQEAEAYAARLLQTLPPDNMVRGYVLAGVGRPAEAVDQLFATGLESSLIFSFIFDFFWDEVRQDPRLPELLVKLNLVEEYRRGREALAQLGQEREREK